MKKIFTAIFAIVLLILCASCGQTKSGNGEPSTISDAEIAQSAYDCIEAAETLCKTGMDVISAAWYFGIYEASDCSTDTVLDRLGAQIGFDASYIEQNGGYSVEQLVNGDNNYPAWEFCLWTTENCLAAANAYTSLGEVLETAKTLLKNLPDNYENYQSLKEYYTKVAVYAAYFCEVTGSYNDMETTVLVYEDDIQAAKEPLLFDFA